MDVIERQDCGYYVRYYFDAANGSVYLDMDLLGRSIGGSFHVGSQTHSAQLDAIQRYMIQQAESEVVGGDGITVEKWVNYLAKVAFTYTSHDGDTHSPQDIALEICAMVAEEIELNFDNIEAAAVVEEDGRATLRIEAGSLETRDKAVEHARNRLVALLNNPPSLEPSF